MNSMHLYIIIYYRFHDYYIIFSRAGKSQYDDDPARMNRIPRVIRL